MGYFLKWVFLLNCLGLGSSIALAQSIDTLETCVELDMNKLKKTGKSLILNTSVDPKTENRQIIVVTYELAQKMFKNIYSKGAKDVYIQMCVNGEFVSVLDPSACGDLGRVEGRRGKLQIEFNRLNIGELDTIRLFLVSLEEEKPPIWKWVSKSFFSPHWGQKQIKAFDQSKGFPTWKIPRKTTDTLLLKNVKQKKRKTARIIGGLLVLTGIMEMTSRERYNTAQRQSKREDVQYYYNQANHYRRAAVVLGGAALLIDLGNVINVFSKGNKRMRAYHKKYPKGQKCIKW